MATPVQEAVEKLNTLSEALQELESSDELPFTDKNMLYNTEFPEIPRIREVQLEKLNDMVEDVLIKVRVAIFGYSDVRDMPGQLAHTLHLLQKECDVPDYGYGHGNKNLRGERIK